MRKFPLYALLVLAVACRLEAASIKGLQVFSEPDYARVVFSLDSAVQPNVDPQLRGNLVFVRFDNTDVSALSSQSYVYDKNPHVESISFLPLASGATVARIKLRHAFSLRTYDIGQPPRFVLEISTASDDQSGKSDKSGKSDITRPDYYSQGLDQMHEGSFEAALMSFRNSIRANRQAPESFYQAGLIRFRQNQPEQAEVNFEHALDSREFSREARLYLAWIAHRRGDSENFRRRWNGFNTAVPDPAARLEVASSHPEIDYRAMQAAAVRDGLSAGPGPAPSLLQDKPQPDEPQMQAAAASPYDGVVNKDSSTVCFALGMQARKDKHFTEALEHFRRAVKFDPSNSEAAFQLGIVCKDLGHAEESGKWFERSLGIVGGTGEQAAEPLSRPESAGSELEQLSAALPKALAAEVETESDSAPALPSGILAKVESNSSPEAGEGRPVAGTTAEIKPVTAAVAVEAGPQDLLGRVRSAVKAFVERTTVPLLRRQVKLLTIIMGALFLITLIGERLATGRIGRWLFGNKTIPVPAGEPTAEGNVKTALDRRNDQVAEMSQRKKQLAQVMARELVSKQKAVPAESQPVAAAGGTGRTIDLRLGRDNAAPVYGADIARRIKAQLASPAEQSVRSNAPGGARDDVKTRLIRQLRAKNWTISDIAQEIGLSREEVKWAVSSGPSAGNEARVSASADHDSRTNGQARELAEKRRPGLTPDQMDREVDMELQINV